MPRNIKTEYSIEGPGTLEDLRWLVEQCVNLPGNSQVVIKGYKEHAPNDWEHAKITVIDNFTQESEVGLVNPAV